jgi:hypothetical protein
VAKLWRAGHGCGETGKNQIHHRDTEAQGKPYFIR